MNNIEIQLQNIKSQNRMGLMTHAVLGYPTMGESEKLMKILAEYSDFLELQIPFSDPIADGETIMTASEIALRNGMNTDKAFEMIRSLASSHELFFGDAKRPYGINMSKNSSSLYESLPPNQSKNPKISPRQTFRAPQKTHAKRQYSNHAFSIPILMMCYYNQVFCYGIEKFCKKAQESGVSGLIVPDIPPEEEKNEKFIKTCLTYDLYPIRVVSPASGEERLKINAKYGKGFVYCVSHFGVTGTKSKLNSELEVYMDRVKKYFRIPISLGFGISSHKQITKIRKLADIGIVGSAIIKNYNDGGLKKVEALVKSLKVATI